MTPPSHLFSAADFNPKPLFKLGIMAGDMASSSSNNKVNAPKISNLPQLCNHFNKVTYKFEDRCKVVHDHRNRSGLNSKTNGTGINMLRSMWLFKHKFHADWTLSRYKAHLVANGSIWQLGVESDETFSPVVKLVTILMVLSLGVSRKRPIHQLDVKNAFLNGNLSETIYMHQLPGFVDTRFPNHVYRLQRSLYGLKQAPRAWFQRFAGYFIRAGFYHNHCDSSLFICKQGSQVFLYMHDPREPHFVSLKRILRYVRGTVDFGLQLYAFATTSLVGYTDVDWAGCPSTPKSTSGYCVFLGDTLLSWSAKCQHTPSLSSAKAKYCGVANVVSETTWLPNPNRELHSPLSTATLIYYDNVNAIYMSTNLVQHQRTNTLRSTFTSSVIWLPLVKLEFFMYLLIFSIQSSGNLKMSGNEDHHRQGRRFAAGGNGHDGRDPHDVEIERLHLEIQHEIRKIWKRIRELELQRELTKETKSEPIIWDIGDEEEEYPFVNKYPSLQEPSMLVQEESCPIYDTDNEEESEVIYDTYGNDVDDSPKFELLHTDQGDSLVIQRVLSVAPSKSIYDDSEGDDDTDVPDGSSPVDQRAIDENEAGGGVVVNKMVVRDDEVGCNDRLLVEIVVVFAVDLVVMVVHGGCARWPEVSPEMGDIAEKFGQKRWGRRKI
nr:ribonuclease H-like domain-containing protein [Tanacetum cinerariifolium]